MRSLTCSRLTRFHYESAYSLIWIDLSCGPNFYADAGPGTDEIQAQSWPIRLATTCSPQFDRHNRSICILAKTCVPDWIFQRIFGPVQR